MKNSKKGAIHGKKEQQITFITSMQSRIGDLLGTNASDGSTTIRQDESMKQHYNRVQLKER